MMKDEYLRDFFAASALDGIMSKTASTTMPASTRDALAKLAYQMADAMLAARDRVEGVDDAGGRWFDRCWQRGIGWRWCSEHHIHNPR